ncbi:MAG: DegT/DnrJ/EryC1/StrS family aminotransferase [Cyanobacteria bacterium]|nr:DegT/DnrJ/EryC1/StrS family aminotransferase [Cyanobacteriota bacterium]
MRVRPSTAGWRSISSSRRWTFRPAPRVIVPAFTFWVVPEIARVAGLTPVFVDIDPLTFTMDPAAAARAVTPNTRAILPTHLYGMSCDMDPILELARRHQLRVIEDCAHSLGATYKGRMVGTHGDASFFSFQAFKPLNTYGGGLAWMRDADVARRVGEYAGAEAWPAEKRVERILGPANGSTRSSGRRSSPIRSSRSGTPRRG